jgi:DNA-binding transcriptional MerR regulator
MQNDTIIRIGHVAAAVGLSPITIRRYERRGWLKPRRDWRGHRLYDQTDIDLLIGIRDGLIDPRSNDAPTAKADFHG